jgi:hypothetical protein
VPWALLSSFTNKTCKDDRTTYRRRSRARRGYRAEGPVQFVRGVGYSVVSALTVDGFRRWRPDALLGGGVFDMRVRLAVFMGPERLQY